MSRPMFTRLFGRRLSRPAPAQRTPLKKKTLRLEFLEDRLAPTVTPLDLASFPESSGTINGAIYTGASFHNETVGSGLIDSFVRVQALGNDTTEQGYNTDARPYEPLNEAGNTATFNHSVQLGQVPVVVHGGTTYYEFALDINQNKSGGDRLLSLDRLQISTSANPNLGDGNDASTWYTSNGTYGGNATLRYDMSGDPNHDYVQLNYNFNDGSGNGLDMFLDVPTANFAGASLTDSVYLFSAFGSHTFTVTQHSLPLAQGGGTEVGTFMGGQANDGFEEWARGREGPLQLHANVATSIYDETTGQSGVTVAGNFDILHDTSTVMAVSPPPGSPTPGGTVTYYFYHTATPDPNNPANGAVYTCTVTMSGGLVPNSNDPGGIATPPPPVSQAFLAAGSYSYLAVYSGDSTYAGSVSSIEPLTVRGEGARRVVITTSQDPDHGAPGVSMTDTATLAREVPGGPEATGYIYFQLTAPNTTIAYTSAHVTVDHFGTYPAPDSVPATMSGT